MRFSVFFYYSVYDVDVVFHIDICLIDHEHEVVRFRLNTARDSRYGKVVSKKASLKAKKGKWIVAVTKARTFLKVKGFTPIGGKTAAGKTLLAKAKS